MLVRIPHVLTPEEVAYARQRLEDAAWEDGRTTAGAQSALVKKNLQIPEGSPVARELGDLVLRALGRNQLFSTAALPLRRSRACGPRAAGCGPPGSPHRPAGSSFRCSPKRPKLSGTGHSGSRMESTWLTPASQWPSSSSMPQIPMPKGAMGSMSLA